MLNNCLHPNTAAMLQAWRRITRSPNDVDGGPSAHEYPGLLGRLFVVESLRNSFAPFRIAGDELTTILGRNLIGTDFLGLWTGADRSLVSALIESVTYEDRPGILRGFGETSLGHRVELEISIAPLKDKAIGRNRMLCLYQTLGGEAMLHNRSIWTHRVRSISPPEPIMKPANLRLVANNDFHALAES